MNRLGKLLSVFVLVMAGCSGGPEDVLPIVGEPPRSVVVACDRPDNESQYDDVGSSWCRDGTTTARGTHRWNALKNDYERALYGLSVFLDRLDLVRVSGSDQVGKVWYGAREYQVGVSDGSGPDGRYAFLADGLVELERELNAHGGSDGLRLSVGGGFGYVRLDTLLEALNLIYSRAGGAVDRGDFDRARSLFSTVNVDYVEVNPETGRRSGLIGGQFSMDEIYGAMVALRDGLEGFPHQSGLFGPSGTITYDEVARRLDLVKDELHRHLSDTAPSTTALGGIYYYEGLGYSRSTDEADLVARGEEAKVLLDRVIRDLKAQARLFFSRWATLMGDRSYQLLQDWFLSSDGRYASFYVKLETEEGRSELQRVRIARPFQSVRWGDYLTGLEVQTRFDDPDKWGDGEEEGYYQSTRRSSGRVEFEKWVSGAVMPAHDDEPTGVADDLGFNVTLPRRTTLWIRHDVAGDPYYDCPDAAPPSTCISSVPAGDRSVFTRLDVKSIGPDLTDVVTHAQPFSRTRSYWLEGHPNSVGDSQGVGFLTVMDGQWLEDRFDESVNVWLAWGSWMRYLGRAPSGVGRDVDRVDMGSFVGMNQPAVSRGTESAVSGIPIGSWTPCPLTPGAGSEGCFGTETENGVFVHDGQEFTKWVILEGLEWSDPVLETSELGTTNCPGYTKPGAACVPLEALPSRHLYKDLVWNGSTSGLYVLDTGGLEEAGTFTGSATVRFDVYEIEKPVLGSIGRDGVPECNSSSVPPCNPTVPAVLATPSTAARAGKYGERLYLVLSDVQGTPLNQSSKTTKTYLDSFIRSDQVLSDGRHLFAFDNVTLYDGPANILDLDSTAATGVPLGSFQRDIVNGRFVDDQGVPTSGIFQASLKGHFLASGDLRADMQGTGNVSSRGDVGHVIGTAVGNAVYYPADHVAGVYSYRSFQPGVHRLSLTGAFAGSRLR